MTTAHTPGPWSVGPHPGNGAGDDWRGAPDDDASTLLLDTAACELPDAALQDILWTARDYYRADPHSDHLPPDHAVIAMYEDHIA